MIHGTNNAAFDPADTPLFNQTLNKIELPRTRHELKMLTDPLARYYLMISIGEIEAAHQTEQPISWKKIFALMNVMQPIDIQECIEDIDEIADGISDFVKNNLVQIMKDKCGLGYKAVPMEKSEQPTSNKSVLSSSESDSSTYSEEKRPCLSRSLEKPIKRLKDKETLDSPRNQLPFIAHYASPIEHSLDKHANGAHHIINKRKGMN